MMNTNGIPHNITLDNCEYTPVYLIQNNSLAQGTSYVLTPVTEDQDRPKTNNLKLFYENSGNIENNLLINNTQYVTKPAASPRLLQEQPGNKLKLASFLIPKNNITNSICNNVTNTIPKKAIPTTTVTSNNKTEPIVSTNGSNLKALSFVSSVVNIEREEITKRRPIPALKAQPQPKKLKSDVISQNKMKNETFVNPAKPKVAPKVPPNHTSVQLLKLGETYHSLNNLNDEQMRIVNKALENIGDPEKSKLKPTYDPATNTRIIYRVVSPNDLKVVGKNKIVVSQQVRTNVKKADEPKKVVPKTTYLEDDPIPEEEVALPKVTRSGRKVKQPKLLQTSITPDKPLKKVTPLTCCLCSAEFLTVYLLQRHYEKYPTHFPSDAHTSLFNCFLSMLGSGTTDEKSGIFVTQLQQFVDKLKSLLPCLLKKVDGNEGFSCVINDDLGRLFGMNAGKYNLNIDALDCVRDNDGHCKHNPPKPPPIQITPEISKPSQLWLTKHQEEIANNEQSMENCARITPVEKWTVKRIWKRKTPNIDEQKLNKKPRLTSEPLEPLIELGSEIQNVLMEPLPLLPVTSHHAFADQNDENNKQEEAQNFTSYMKKANGSHTQFHSAHFDIRSSPIKPSAAIFSKFQIIPEKMPLRSDVKLLRPLIFDNQQEESVESNTEHSLDGILKELNSNHNTNSDSNDLSCKESDALNGLTFDNSKVEWQNDEQSHDSFLKPNILIQPSMIHVSDNGIDNKSYNDNASFNVNTVNFNTSSIVASDDNCVSNGVNFNTSSIVASDDNCVSNGVNLDNDNSLSSLNQGASVLNFLDSLTSECLTCPDAEMRNNSIDFQLDLFSFNPS